MSAPKRLSTGSCLKYAPASDASRHKVAAMSIDVVAIRCHQVLMNCFIVCSPWVVMTQASRQ